MLRHGSLANNFTWYGEITIICHWFTEVISRLQCTVAMFFACFHDSTMKLEGSLESAMYLVSRWWKWLSWCRYGDSDAEMEFLELLLESACVFWRKVPMCTLQCYFGKSATGYCSLWQAKKRLHYTPYLSILNQCSYVLNFPKIKSGDTGT